MDQLKFTPIENLQKSIFKTPQNSTSLISSIRYANPVKCSQFLAYGFLHRSSRFNSRKLRAYCCSSFNSFPHENGVHKSIESNPSKHLLPLKVEFLDPTSLGIYPEPPNWPERDEIRRFTIEQKANNMGIQHSLRFIKRKQGWKLDSFIDNASELAYSSVKNAISSLLFIIREIQNYTLIIREGFYSEDLMVVMSKIQQDMTLTFVWLFQHVFSKTPTLMVYVMLLLANFSIQSMTEKASFDAIQQGFSQKVVTETVLVSDKESEKEEQEDQCPKVNGEVRLLKSIMDEASRMRGESIRKALDYHIRQQLVSPLHVELEPDNYEVHFRTDLVYQMCIAEYPNNALLLAKYAQFLHLIVKDYDRAEECFKCAIGVDPQDVEALGLSADFFWQVRNDHWRAEEMYLQAIKSDSKKSFQTLKYANFLWSTGGEGTCFVFDASK